MFGDEFKEIIFLNELLLNECFIHKAGKGLIKVAYRYDFSNYPSQSVINVIIIRYIFIIIKMEF